MTSPEFDAAAGTLLWLGLPGAALLLGPALALVLHLSVVGSGTVDVDAELLRQCALFPASSAPICDR